MLKIDKNSDVLNIDSNSLIDCYRIALDFGMPAAIKAMEHLQKNDEAEIIEPAASSLLSQTPKNS